MIFHYKAFIHQNNNRGGLIFFFKEKQQDSLVLQIDNEKSYQSIPSILALLESNKYKLKIETFSIFETSLEQIFLLLNKK